MKQRENKWHFHYWTKKKFGRENDWKWIQPNLNPFFFNVRIVFWFFLCFASNSDFDSNSVFDSHTLDFCIFGWCFEIDFFSGYSRFSKQQLQQGKRFPILVQWLIGDTHCSLSFIIWAWFIDLESHPFFSSWIFLQFSIAK